MKKKRHNINFEDCNSSKISGAKLFLLIIVSLFSYPINAQLSNFTLQVTKTDETCPGNGTLNFTVSNTTPGATLNYKVYKLPNLVNEIANISTAFIGGLSNGTYRVVATQTLSPNSNTQTQDISIANALVPFDISVASTNAICGNDATITVNTITGSAVSYEITSGPVTRPVQSSNIFTALPAGTFQVRAFDICGEASVETRTIFTTTPQMTVGSASFLDAELPGCDLITASHGLESPDNSIHYPIQYQFTVYPPDGSDPIVSSGNLTSGAIDYQVLSHVIPFYHDQVYSYDLQVIDYCGVVHNVNNNVVNQKINLIINPLEAECDTYFLSLVLTKYRGPFTITFLEAPAGFDPSLFNTSFPGSFSATETLFGEETNPLPMGEYTIEINDACGRTTSQTIVLEYIPVEPIINTSQTGGCSATTGNIKIELPNRMITSATIIAAPPEYTPTLPQNVSSNIIPNDGLQLIEIPVGTYVFILFDECGKEYTAEATITTSTNNEVGFNSRPDCEIGKGAVRIRAAGSGLVSVIITAAPAGFQNALPFNASFNIGTNGNFSMANLPPGNYTFNTINGCGSAKTLFITITGYAVTTDEFELFQHCGSFDFFFSHSSNGLAGQSFWLQKLDPITNTWMHPETNVPYAEGSNPESSNSLSLFNSVTLYNLTYTGTFRIIKRYETFDNGSIGELKNCINTLHEFTYTGILQINGLESLTCNGVISDVKVLVNGVPPFEFKIIEKNGAPFIINNGTSAIFTNLDPAVYKFEVTDACGVIRNYEFDVALLPSPVFANQPDKYVLCDDSSNDGVENFMLSSLNAQILGNQSAVDYSIKYYETISDANSEINALSEFFSSPTQAIFARVNHPTSLSCFAITVVNLEVKEHLILNMDTKFSFCDNTNTTVHADSGYDSYVWSDGQTGSSATFDQPGIYTLTFTKEYDAVICSATHQIEITKSNAPIIKEILLEDWTDYNNSIEVLLEIGNGDYAYSLDNIHFQSENIFTGLQTGAFTVYVKDKNGCGPDAIQDVFLLTYPKFFTPNGDGFNDFWRIKFSFMEPNMLIYIFDRYGKLITGFGANDPGWDGTLNGRALPSTDYWFLVKRENGKEHRGHFAMKR